MKKDDTDYIINILRRGTTSWPGRTECLNRNRRKRIVGTYKNGNEKFLWERDCDGCNEPHLLKDNDLEVDHVDPVKGFDGDWNNFINRLYCHQDNLQALCIPCHLKKTNIGNATMRFERKIKGREEDAL